MNVGGERIKTIGPWTFYLQGARWIDSALTDRDLTAERDVRQRAQADRVHDVAVRLATLTVREREVLDGVVSGLLNKQIAGRLGIVEKTVKVHRARAVAKMGARSTAELVRMVEAAGHGDANAEAPVGAV